MVTCSKFLKKYLTEHNALADITGCLVRLAVALELTYSVEQPRSSLLWSYPPVLQALAGSDAINVPFFMSAFQGESPKPLSLRGNAPWLKFMKAVAKIDMRVRACPANAWQRMRTARSQEKEQL